LIALVAQMVFSESASDRYRQVTEMVAINAVRRTLGDQFSDLFQGQSLRKEDQWNFSGSRPQEV
jgi:hypothetical protein